MEPNIFLEIFHYTSNTLQTTYSSNHSEYVHQVRPILLLNGQWQILDVSIDPGDLVCILY